MDHETSKLLREIARAKEAGLICQAAPPDPVRVMRKERLMKNCEGVHEIVRTIARMKDLPVEAFYGGTRGVPEVASARVLAVALCAAHGEPLGRIARALGRTWATVYAAERRCSARYHESAEFRKEWNTLFDACAKKKGEP